MQRSSRRGSPRQRARDPDRPMGESARVLSLLVRRTVSVPAIRLGFTVVSAADGAPRPRSRDRQEPFRSRVLDPLNARPVLALIVMCSVLTSCAPVPRGSASTADGIMQAVAEVYRTCRSYEDAGTLTEVSVKEGVPGPAERTAFGTRFERTTGAFRTTFARSDGVRGTIWRPTAGPVHTWWTVKSGIRDMQLSYAIGAFAGVSRGTVSLVPALLEGLPTSLDGLDFHRDGGETIRGVYCIRLSARRDAHVVVVWIGVADHVIRRLLSSEPINPRALAASAGLEQYASKDVLNQVESTPPYIAVDTFDFEAVLDRPIDPASFAFTPTP